MQRLRDSGKTLLGIGLGLALTVAIGIVLQTLGGGGEAYATPVGFALSAWWMYRWLEREKGWAVGWKGRRQGERTLAGGAVGTVIVSLTVSLMLATGNVSLESMPFEWRTIAGQAALFAAVAIGEEWFFRGYAYGVYRRSMSAFGAAVWSSIWFTSIHLINPEAFERPAVFIAAEMGNIFLLSLLFAWARERSGSLWMPVGMHFVVNGLQSTVFGFTNGGKELPSLFRIAYHSETVWNGGGYGLESSLVYTPLLLGATVAAYVHLNRPRGRKASKGASS